MRSHYFWFVATCFISILNVFTHKIAALRPIEPDAPVEISPNFVEIPPNGFEIRPAKAVSVNLEWTFKYSDMSSIPMFAFSGDTPVVHDGLATIKQSNTKTKWCLIFH